MNAKLDGWLLSWKCSDESRGPMIYQLSKDPKKWQAVMKELKLETLTDLRDALQAPLKKV